MDTAESFALVEMRCTECDAKVFLYVVGSDIIAYDYSFCPKCGGRNTLDNTAGPQYLARVGSYGPERAPWFSGR